MAAALAALVACALPGVAGAAELGPGCGQTIDSSSTLTADIGPCTGTGITIGADGVTLDLNGHRIFGSDGPGNGSQAGIRLDGRVGVTVTNGTVSGFDAGLFLSGGSANAISNMTIADNIGPDDTNSLLGDGIYVLGSSLNRITDNTISRNGIFDGIGIYGSASNGNVVLNNVIESSVGPTIGGHDGQGIIINAYSGITPVTGEPEPTPQGQQLGLTVEGNVVSGNVVRHNASAGIANINHVQGIITGNTIIGNGVVNEDNGLGVQLGPLAKTAGTRMLIEGNEIHRNGRSGIEINVLAVGNQILNNNASGNNIVGARQRPSAPTVPDVDPEDPRFPDVLRKLRSGDNEGAFDLADRNYQCDGNTWFGNTWGKGGFSSECTTIGGQEEITPAVAPADFNGDGASDISVFRAGSGSWFPQGGTDGYWGTEGDIAVPGDYDGVTGSEMAVFRPSSGTWFVKGGDTTAWGTEGDLAVPGDYDGDARTDLAVFRPSAGIWYIHPSGGGPDQTVNWGTAGDIPVPGDYDGNGTSDIAVFRPSSGTWFVHLGITVNWGTVGDIPVPGDYDADGTTDVAVFRPSSGTWFVEGGATTAWGTSGDIPVPGDFDGNATADIAVFRPSSGTWFVLDGLTTNWGTAGDQLLPLPPAIRQSL